MGNLLGLGVETQGNCPRTPFLLSIWGTQRLRPQHNLDFALALPRKSTHNTPPPEEPSGLLGQQRICAEVSDAVMGDLESVTPDTLLPCVSPGRAIAKIKRHLGPGGKKESIIRDKEGGKQTSPAVEEKNVT